jgi:hypothetical protein
LQFLWQDGLHFQIVPIKAKFSEPKETKFLFLAPKQTDVMHDGTHQCFAEDGYITQPVVNDFFYAKTKNKK